MISMWKKEIWIAKFLDETDDDGVPVPSYSEPKRYMFNVQPVSGEMEITAWGNRVYSMQRAIISIGYKGQFKEKDLVYYGVNPTNAEANYVIVAVREQNRAIVLFIEKLQV